MGSEFSGFFGTGNGDSSSEKLFKDTQLVDALIKNPLKFMTELQKIDKITMLTQG